MQSLRITATGALAIALLGIASAGAQTWQTPSVRRAARRPAASPSPYQFMGSVGFPEPWHPAQRASHSGRATGPRSDWSTITPAARPGWHRKPVVRAEPQWQTPQTAGYARSSASPYAFMDTVGFPEPYRHDVTGTTAAATVRSGRGSTSQAHTDWSAGSTSAAATEWPDRGSTSAAETVRSGRGSTSRAQTGRAAGSATRASGRGRGTQNIVDTPGNGRSRGTSSSRARRTTTVLPDGIIEVP